MGVIVLHPPEMQALLRALLPGLREALEESCRRVSEAPASDRLEKLAWAARRIGSHMAFPVGIPDRLARYWLTTSAATVGLSLREARAIIDEGLAEGAAELRRIVGDAIEVV